MIKLKIHQLESFMEAAATGSFRQAAERMHRSPSAVSAHIQQLEDQLEVPLLERTTRRMKLTPEGRLLLSRCEHILAELDTAAQEVHDASVSRRARISIGVSPSVSRHHLLPVIARHQKEHPEFALEIHEAFADALYEQLAARTTDFAIGPGISGRHDFHARPVIRDPIVAIVPKGFALKANGSVALEALSREAQICMPKGTAIRQVIEQAFKVAGLPFFPKFEVMYPQGLFDMVAADVGVAMMPLLSVPPKPYKGFKTAPLTPGSMYREMCMITLKSRKLSLQARKLADLLSLALKSGVITPE
jgi:DNA-binding transcriptional LysR family regulator